MKLDNLPANQLTASHVEGWSTRGLVHSPKCLTDNLE